eukprot:Rmarinus@m.14542
MPAHSQKSHGNQLVTVPFASEGMDLMYRWLKKTLLPDLATICQLDEFRLGRPRMAFKVQVVSNGQEAGNDHDTCTYIPIVTAPGKVLLVFKSPKENDHQEQG